VLYFEVSLPPFVASQDDIRAIEPITWDAKGVFSEPKARAAWVLLSSLTALGDLGLLILAGRVVYRCVLTRRPDLSVGGHSLLTLLTVLRGPAFLALVIFVFTLFALIAISWSIIWHLGSGERFGSPQSTSLLEQFVTSMLGNLSVVSGRKIADDMREWFVPGANAMLAVTVSIVTIAITSTASGWLERIDDFIDDDHVTTFNGKSPGLGPPAGPYDVLVFTQGERVNYLKRLIYASAALESLSIASLTAFFVWLTSDNLVSTDAMSIGQIYVFRFSGLCSAGLIFLYVSTAMTLGWRAGRIEPYFRAGSVVPYGTRQNDMQVGLGIDLGILEHIGAIVATMLPLATGAATSTVTGWF
jgi:hypothetical protein